MIKVRAKVSEKGPGIGKLVETLGGLGHVTLGVQGEEALKKHSESELTIGDVAAIWELGLSPNGPRRSWLSSWIDANQERMVAEARQVFQDIIAGKMSRRRGFQKLGFQWAKEIRENLAAGRVSPGLKASTVKLKGHAIPLVDTYDLHNAISYKVFLPRWKNVPGGSASGAQRLMMAKTIPASGTEEKGLQQPSNKGVMFGPRERRGLRPKYGPRGPAKQGPRQQRYGVVFRRKYVGMNSTQYAGMRARKARGLGGMFKAVSRPRAQAALNASRKIRKASWAIKWLKRMAKQVLRTSKQGDGRNHGYNGSSRFGATGRAGRRR